MKIYTYLEYKWAKDHYVLDKSESLEYTDLVAKCCGSTQQQNNTYNTQTAITTQLVNQMQQTFGLASNVFNDLQNTFAPILAAGPNQQGLSPAELSTLNAAAIDTTASQYQSAKTAIGEQEAAMGGGNIPLPSGAEIAPQLALSQGAAQQTSNLLNQNQQLSYQLGRQNWLTAASGLAGSTSVFNPATQIAGATVNSGEAQANTANQIASQNNSWVNAVVGGLSGIAGSYIGNAGWV